MISKPAAKRNTLALIAGIVWLLTGAFLSSVAIQWLLGSERGYQTATIGGGILAGWGIYRLKFAKLAGQNLDRIYEQSPGNEKVCIFAFQNTRSYFLVVTMMTMGYVVRHSGLPEPFLAPFYLAIGTAMLLSSLLYFRHLRHKV